MCTPPVSIKTDIYILLLVKRVKGTCSRIWQICSYIYKCRLFYCLTCFCPRRVWFIFYHGFWPVVIYAVEWIVPKGTVSSCYVLEWSVLRSKKFWCIHLDFFFLLNHSWLDCYDFLFFIFRFFLLLKSNGNHCRSLHCPGVWHSGIFSFIDQTLLVKKT